MDIAPLIQEIRDFLHATFAEIDLWFDKDPGLRNYQPENGGWTINQILEHIGLTNHFLLILIEKGTQKALNNANDPEWKSALENYHFHKDQLTEIGLYQSFAWIRPEHMEPKGEKTLPEVRAQLRDQLAQCLHCLNMLKNGEGALYKTTMTVNNLGKIDVYEYIYFLGQHGQRHLTQMQRNAQAYELLNPSA
ncbi:MAG: DinB family protein [Saprospiraceae bacterium]|nr:DinB family protein [Saprospiraceae bacterium]